MSTIADDSTTHFLGALGPKTKTATTGPESGEWPFATTLNLLSYLPPRAQTEMWAATLACARGLSFDLAGENQHITFLQRLAYRLHL